MILENHVHCSVLLFVIIMLGIYVIKPNFIYDKDRNEFKQFGIDKGKTVLPIYIIGIIVAVLSYIIIKFASNTSQRKNNVSNINTIDSKTYTKEINEMQLQIQQMMQQQLMTSLMNNYANNCMNTCINNPINKYINNNSIGQQKQYDNFPTILPNHFSI